MIDVLKRSAPSLAVLFDWSDVWDFPSEGLPLTAETIKSKRRRKIRQTSISIYYEKSKSQQNPGPEARKEALAAIFKAHNVKAEIDTQKDVPYGDEFPSLRGDRFVVKILVPQKDAFAAGAAVTEVRDRVRDIHALKKAMELEDKITRAEMSRHQL